MKTNFEEFMEINIDRGCNADIARHYYLSDDKIDNLVPWAKMQGIDKDTIIKSIGILYNLTLDHAAIVVNNRI